MAHRAAIAAIAIAVVTAGCAGDGDGDGGGGGGAVDFGRVETVAEGLEVPWAIAFVDEDTLLVTERPGRVRLIEDGRLRPEPVAVLDVFAEGEAGLLGIALHPEFPDQRFAYVYSTAVDGNRVTRFRVRDDFGFEDEQVLLRIPAGVVHDGGRIAFGPDGHLYAATGDTGQPPLAADAASLAGKLLRITVDGGIPDDNPFPDSPVFSYGHRNPQGLDWDGRGRLYAAEHGPTGENGSCCHDEVNQVEAGGFYGWPFYAGASATGLRDPPAESIAPIVESGGDDTWAPAGLAVDESGSRVYVALLAGERLLRVDLETEQVAVALDGHGRLREAVFGPDGCLYLTTSNTDGRGTPREGDDRVLRACR